MVSVLILSIELRVLAALIGQGEWMSGDQAGLEHDRWDSQPSFFMEGG